MSSKKLGKVILPIENRISQSPLLPGQVNGTVVKNEEPVQSLLVITDSN
jgi:hypothetical protein